MGCVPGALVRLPGPAIRPGDRAPVVSVRGVGVRYDLRLRRRASLREAIEQAIRRDGARASIWALRGIDLEVGAGDAVAVVGRNGAGKSTLLLVIAGILAPDEGDVRVAGRVGSLLALGAGFDQELTGRENIALATAFMGIDAPATRALTPGIMEFAGLGPFIDAPLKTYSAGMRARLGFAVATAIGPEVLLIDEVLATGDVEFRARCRERIAQLVGGAHAAVVVTHDLDYALECTRALWLEAGRVAAFGEPAAVVRAYRQAVEAAGGSAAAPARSA